MLIDEQHPQKLSRGTARRHALQVDGIRRPAAARIYGADAQPGLAETVRFEWSALDAWFEEDEQVYVHPRNPYTRVDALRSTRPVRIELDGAVLADSRSPVMVFENRAAHPLLHQSDRCQLRSPRPDRDRHRVPVQGNDGRLLVGTDPRSDDGIGDRTPGSGVDVRLPDPTATADQWADRVLQRAVDTFLDGELLLRPKTHFFP